MQTEQIVRLTTEHLYEMVGPTAFWPMVQQLQTAYLSPGSIAYCLLVDGKPVFAGGIVNMMWHRGEAWLLPPEYFLTHIKTCLYYAKYMLDTMAKEGDFRRVQATCPLSISPTLFKHLGFSHEGTMFCFGPNGEDCHMYAKVFS